MSINLAKPQRVPLQFLIPWNPFTYPCWLPKPVAPRAVAEAIAQNQLEETPWAKLPGCKKDKSLLWHARRIAYLVVHHSPKPIDIDLGVPSMGCIVDHIVIDGNHRLAAAFYRGAEFIRASIAGEEGCIKEFLECGHPCQTR